MKSAKVLLKEMAIDTGGEPNWIDRDKQRRISANKHPYEKNKGFPKEPGEGSWPDAPEHPQRPAQGKHASIKSYADLLASDEYKRIVARIRKYTGRTFPNTQVGVQQVGQLFMQSAQQAESIESEHKEELQTAAVDLILGLPEFELAKKAVADGQLIVIAKLETPTADGMKMEPEGELPQEGEDEDTGLPAVPEEYTDAMGKRRLLNVMIHGSAMNKNYAFNMIKDTIDAIDPQLMSLYGTIMSGSELMYWAMPDSAFEGMMGGGEPAGKEEIEINDEVATIRATARCFPVLCQEIAKGLMEFLSAVKEDDEEFHDAVRDQTDVLSNEPWDVKFGAPVWRQFLRMLGSDNQNLMPYVYRKIAELPSKEFAAIMHGVLQGTPEAKRFVKKAVDDTKRELQAAQEDPEPEPWKDSYKDEGSEGDSGGEKGSDDFDPSLLD